MKTKKKTALVGSATTKGNGWHCCEVALPGKGDSNSHGAGPFHPTISMIKWIRIRRLSIKNSLSRPPTQRAHMGEGVGPAILGVQGSGFKGSGSGFRVQGLGSRVQGFRVQGSGVCGSAREHPIHT